MLDLQHQQNQLVADSGLLRTERDEAMKSYQECVYDCEITNSLTLERANSEG